jgi:serine/threonine protein phosphatase PrpC
MSTPTGPIFVRAVGVTDAGNVRTQNEDSFVVADLTTRTHGDAGVLVELDAAGQGVLLAVSDGMGGALAGDVASALVIDSLRDSLDGPADEAHVAREIKAAAETANRVVWDAAQERSRAGMGATLTAVVVHGALAHVAQVGDSRAYLLRRSQIRQVTKDQSYVAVLVEAGVLTREQAEASPYKNAILQAMGTKPEVNVALGRIELRRGDIVLVCSDGLWGKMEDEEIYRAVRSSPGLTEAGAALVALAKERGGEDNITVVLAEVSGAGLKEPRETVTNTYQSIDPSTLEI